MRARGAGEWSNGSVEGMGDCGMVSVDMALLPIVVPSVKPNITAGGRHESKEGEVMGTLYSCYGRNGLRGSFFCRAQVSLSFPGRAFKTAPNRSGIGGADGKGEGK